MHGVCLLGFHLTSFPPQTVYTEISCIMQITQEDWFTVWLERGKYNCIENYYITHSLFLNIQKETGRANQVVEVSMFILFFVLLLPWFSPSLMLFLTFNRTCWYQGGIYLHSFECLSCTEFSLPLSKHIRESTELEHTFPHACFEKKTLFLLLSYYLNESKPNMDIFFNQVDFWSVGLRTDKGNYYSLISSDFLVAHNSLELHCNISKSY